MPLPQGVVLLQWPKGGTAADGGQARVPWLLVGSASCTQRQQPSRLGVPLAVWPCGQAVVWWQVKSMPEAELDALGSCVPSAMWGPRPSLCCYRAAAGGASPQARGMRLYIRSPFSCCCRALRAVNKPPVASLWLRNTPPLPPACRQCLCPTPLLHPCACRAVAPSLEASCCVVWSLVWCVRLCCMCCGLRLH